MTNIMDVQLSSDQLQLPTDLVAERATLGACLLDRDAIVGIASWLLPQHFYLEKHGWIFEAILDCYQRGTPPDLSTVVSRLRSNNRLEAVGGLMYLMECSDAVPTAVHVGYYAQHVHDTYAQRQVIELGAHITASGYQNPDVHRLYEELRSKLEETTRNRRAAVGLSSAQILATAQQPVQWLIPGVLSEGFGYLAAQPGTGKTWMLIQWAIAIATGGRVFSEIEVPQLPVVFLALEDTQASLKERLAMVLGDHTPPPDNVVWYTEEMALPPLDDGGVGQLEAIIQTYQPGLVVIDTLTAIAPETGRGANPYRAEYQAYLPIRHLANRYNCAILGSWHFNKAARTNVLEMVSGTMGLPAVSVNRIGLVRDHDQAEARLVSRSKRGAEADWTLSFDASTCLWSRLGDTRSHRLSTERSMIVSYLEEQPEGSGRLSDIAQTLDIPYNNAAQLLKSMVEDGQIRRGGRGVYVLCDQFDRQFDRTDDQIDRVFDRTEGNNTAPQSHFDRFDRKMQPEGRGGAKPVNCDQNDQNCTTVSNNGSDSDQIGDQNGVGSIKNSGCDQKLIRPIPHRRHIRTVDDLRKQEG